MDIFSVDDQSPEAMAMLQALYSRSAKSVREHLELVRKRGSSKFMESYYVGYGHASIGDCGHTTLFIENVSILAAKAIQDNPLYSGQETSTRYIDFASQGSELPSASPDAKSIFSDIMEFYESAQEPLFLHICGAYRHSDREFTATEMKALNARKFDILRAFLPAGLHTQLSWSTNLRQAADHLRKLSSHPLVEVRDIASKIKSELQQKYPSSFSHKNHDEIYKYDRENAQLIHYPTELLEKFDHFKGDVLHLDIERYQAYKDALADRPKYGSLPRDCGRVARFRFRFPLDFGSFRDLQRHRNGFCPSLLLTTDLGFEAWYLDQLPESLKPAAVKLLSATHSRIQKLLRSGEISKFDAQYLVPIGYKVFCDIEYDLSQAVYVAELRSGQTVHPTLRDVANHMADFIKLALGDVALYNDNSPDTFSVKRGLQDIVKRSDS